MKKFLTEAQILNQVLERGEALRGFLSSEQALNAVLVKEAPALRIKLVGAPSGGDQGISAPGERGESAYEIAKRHGFKGSEVAWLESLKGERGEAGSTGERGIQGQRGERGEAGKSAYQIALEEGFHGDKVAWLESLKGEKGEAGDTGQRGERGEAGGTGARGESAYEIAKRHGFNGSEAAWLESLKGGGGGGSAPMGESTPVVLGLLWEEHSHTFKRFGKGFDTRAMGEEFNAWLPLEAPRQNDNDTFSPSPLTRFLDSSPHLPYASMKRQKVNDLGERSEEGQVVVPLKPSHYIQALLEGLGRKIHLYAISLEPFELDLKELLGGVSMSVSFWEGGTLESGALEGGKLKSRLHPLFITSNTGGRLSEVLLGAYPGIGGRSQSGGFPDHTLTIAKARERCEAVGARWGLQNYFAADFKRLLLLLEAGTFSLNRAGLKWSAYTWNISANSPSHLHPNGLSDPLGSVSGTILDSHGRVIKNNYRGIEDFLGGGWEFCEGALAINNTLHLAYSATFGAQSPSTNPEAFFYSVALPSPLSGTYYAKSFLSGSFIPASFESSGNKTKTPITNASSGTYSYSVGGSLWYPQASPFGFHAGVGLGEKYLNCHYRNAFYREA